MGGLNSVSICYTIPVYSWVKLGGKSVFHPDNLVPVLFFGCLITIGYSSVVLTIYEMATGQKVVGDRADVLRPS